MSEREEERGEQEGRFPTLFARPANADLSGFPPFPFVGEKRRVEFRAARDSNSSSVVPFAIAPL